MKRRSIDQLVYDCMYPEPKPSDPANFHIFLTQHLVFEVRKEVHLYFGHLSTQEARYPGLDYCNPAHRTRLSRWPLHGKLFAAFDTLRLTNAEIYNLTKWEGTKWAKERFEKEHGVTIPDTSADGMPDWREPGSRWKDSEDCVDTLIMAAVSPHERTPERRRHGLRGGADNEDGNDDGNEDEDDPMDIEHGDDVLGTPTADNGVAEIRDRLEVDIVSLDAAGDEDSEEEILSIGLHLNERLLERVAAHNAGDTSQPLDEDWEQWLKNALEAGNLDLVAQHLSRLSRAALTPRTPTAPAGTPVEADSGTLAPSTTVARATLRRVLQGPPRNLPRPLMMRPPQPPPQAAHPPISTESSSSLTLAGRRGPLLPSSASPAPLNGASSLQPPTGRRTYASLRLPSSNAMGMH